MHNAPTTESAESALRDINFALRSYERCAARASERTSHGWDAIASMLWTSMQGPAAIAVLPLGSERRRFVADRYRDADGWRQTASLREEGAELARARAYLRGELPLFGARPLTAPRAR